MAALCGIRCHLCSTSSALRKPKHTMTDVAGEGTDAFHPSLVRRLIQPNLSSSSGKNHQTSGSNKRVTDEAVVAAGEVLRLFVLEARHRAGIEAECELEGAVYDESDKHGSPTAATTSILVRADHITKIGAELLMDFS